MKRIVILFLLAVFLCPTIAQSRELSILCYGDSLLSGYKLTDDENFAVILEEKLNNNGIEAKVINQSVVGQTSGGGLKNIDKILDSHHYQLVILQFGGNDVYRGVATSMVENNLQQMINKIITRGGRVLLVGNRSPSLKGIYKNLANRNRLILYPHILLGISGKKHLTLGDRIHPNADGVVVMVNNITPFVKKSLHRR
ncbi:MAG: GDSL-type esterase/lipase family protein [Alphaproteobacteria bacterium]